MTTTIQNSISSLRSYILPWPPSINHLYGRHGNRTFIKKAGTEYHRRVQELVGKITPFLGRLEVAIEVFEPDKRRRDMDNLLKISQDSMQKAGVFKDDSQIDKLLIERAGYIQGGCIIVIVKELKKNEAVDGNKRRKKNTKVGTNRI